jgi:hypothetical protein
MSLATVRSIFPDLLPLEEALYAKLDALRTSSERIVLVSGDSIQNIRGAFLRWFLLEAIPSSQLPITQVRIDQAVFADTLDLRASSVDLLLSFVRCTFKKSVELSDAKIIGLEMIGGSGPEISADRIVVKGSLRLTERTADKIGGPHIGQLRLCGAEITGNLDMRGCTVEPVNNKQDSPPLFADGLMVHGNALLSGGFKSVGEIRLNGCKIDRNLDCSGANLSNPGGYSLSAAGAHIKGSAYFSKTAPWLTYPVPFSFASKGTLRLEGAEIEGNLDCSAGTFSATAFLTKQDKPPQKDLYAISADGVKVGADVLFWPDEKQGAQFSVQGIVSMINARVGGDFACSSGNFDFPGEESLVADGIVVEGATFFDQATVNGMLRFVQANLKQGFYLNGAKFETRAGCKSWTTKDENIAANQLGGPACGVYAPDAQIGGTFRWREVTKSTTGGSDRVPFWLFVPGAKASRVDDDPPSWDALDRFEVTGCDYGSFVNMSDIDVSWRLYELDRQYAAMNINPGTPDFALAVLRTCRRLRFVFSPAQLAVLAYTLDSAVKRFKPQPYVQLAKTFRDAAYDDAATQVLVRLKRNETRYSDGGFFYQFWRYLLDIFLCYGYEPFRPVLFVLAWSVVSAYMFQVGYDGHQIVASADNLEKSAVTKSGATGPAAGNPDPTPRVAFNAIVYALDTLVPIVDLNQKKNWIVSPTRSATQDPVPGLGVREEIERVWQASPKCGLGLLYIFNTFFGWLMTTLFAAGVTGLLVTGGDD